MAHLCVFCAALAADRGGEIAAPSHSEEELYQHLEDAHCVIVKRGTESESDFADRVAARYLLVNTATEER